MKTEKILVMINGDRHTITGEDGKYWLCGETRFRKLSKQIASIEEVETPGAEIAAEPEPEAEPKKKPAPRKKKKAEPSEEEQKEGE